MSLMGTLAKVAIGVAVAKGVSSMTKGARGSASGGLFGEAQTAGRSGGTGTGLEDMMGSILGGSRSRSSGSAGGIGDLLEGLTGGATRPTRGGAAQGGIGDLLGGLLGGAAAGGAAGGLGDLLGSLTGQGAARSNDRSFGDMLNSSFSNRGEPEIAPTAEQNAVAGLMLKAMIQAAKADGKVDAAEQKKLLGNLGDVSAEEQAFVQAELRAPIDVAGLARLVPDGLEAQVYTMSVMAIDLDNQNEAQYLHELAQKLGLDQRNVNHIHAQLGVPALYA